MNTVFVVSRVAGFLFLSTLLFNLSHSGDCPPPVSTPPLPVAYLQPSDAYVPTPYPVSISVLPTELTDPVASIALQDRQIGPKVLYMGFTKGKGFAHVPALLNAATGHWNYPYVYLYDEMFWSTDSKVKMGLDEAAINIAADDAHHRGYKTVVSIMPWIILHPDFKLQDSNKYDVILVDPYPTVASHLPTGLNNDLHGCAVSFNLISNLLGCSIQKLREQGYKGEVWYAYQAFKFPFQTYDEIKTDLMWQRETLLAAKSLGASGLMPYGFDLSKSVSEHIEPLRGSGIGLEGLLFPPN